MNREEIVKKVRNAGVVGAGGAGFPTHAKLSATVDTVVVNGAECEPLLHKDKELMRTSARWMVEGLLFAMEAVSAERGIIGIKKKAVEAIDALNDAIKGESSLELSLLGDFYPAGDELVLARETTGRVVPFGTLPFQSGLVISNTETMIWIARAMEGIPVTRKTLTVNGAVAQPVTMTVPIGAPLSSCISAAGGAICDFPVVISGGVMMGNIITDLNQPVTKTTAGLIVLPPDHPLALRKGMEWKQIRKIGHSACDSCSYCTEFCPRYLLGHPVQPHRVMRTLGMGGRQAQDFKTEWARGCVQCGLCGMFSCPEDLRPDAVCGQGKMSLPREVASKPGGRGEAHPSRDGRKVPIKKLVRRIGLKEYDVPAPLTDSSFMPVEADFPLRQHIGAPSSPVVKEGAFVKAGELIADIPKDSLGARIHSSVDGRVKKIASDRIFIEVI